MFTTSSTDSGSVPGWSLRAPVIHGALVAAAAVTLFPLVWMLATAFTPNDLVFRRHFALWPSDPTLGNFITAFKVQPVGYWLVNSLLISAAIAAGKILISVPAAFAFAHLHFRGREWLFGMVIGTMTIPYVITLIPTYIVIVNVELYNTRTGVILPSVAFCGFAIFFLRQSFRAIPTELLEAAAIDGAGPLRALLSIVVPNTLPAIASLSILSFLSAWNLYLWPHLILNDPEMKTLSIGLKLFATNQEQLQQWAPLMAAAVTGLLPVLVVFAVAQRFIINAFVQSGMK